MGSPSTVSADTLLLWEALPQFVQDQDAANGYPFLSYLEGGGSLLQTVDSLVRDDADGNPGWSILFDLTRCPTAYLPWLAQCVGVRLPPSYTDAQMRAAIRNPRGWARGTLAYIEGVANSLIASGYSVTILERTPDPYSYTIQVPSAAVQGSTFGQLAAKYATFADVKAAYATFGDITAQTDALVAALKAVNPGGLIQTVTFV